VVIQGRLRRLDSRDYAQLDWVNDGYD